MTTWKSDRLIVRTPGGKVRTWQVFVEGDRYFTETGDFGGSATRRSVATVCFAKNVGRSNERSAEVVSIDTAKSKTQSKLDEGYVRTLEELAEQDAVPRAMLAKPNFNKEIKHLEPMLAKGKVYVQPKLDGYRCLADRRGLWTRDLRRITTCTHIERQLKPVFDMHPDLVIDGELYNHRFCDDFGKIQSILTKAAPELFDATDAEALVQFHVYDFVSDDHFVSRVLGGRKLLGGFKLPAVVMVKTFSVLNFDEIYSKHSSFVRQRYEGTMIRTSSGGYEQNKRAKQLIKLKDFDDEEFTIVGVNEGKGQWSGYAKSITCRMAGSDKTFNAGCSGTQPQLRVLLERSDQYIGGKATVQFPSKFPSGVPRFPVATKYFTR